uniref:NADH-ubiquinone oxidoreductase chain 2 n=1 Tax=Tenebrionoidea sp. 16 KM-2017 TaxID=2219471 RepID=A0A346RHL4_9CUCU|nr:NADH dehydrogenase subunit 2 [Tenebrionoidea sp. 16 KM-2017]
MLNLYKIVFLNSMVLGTLISITSYSWFSMWMGLEINLLSIIPLFNSSKNMMSSESSMKYFITQALASLVLLFSIIMMLSSTEFITPQVNSSFLMMLNSALLIKLGAAPFHFWFPEVMEGLTWMNSLILLTWQKVAPMILIMNNKLNISFLTFVVFSCLIISSLNAINQVSLRKIMAFSSINHIGWMISAMMNSFSVWLIYFLVYILISINIVVVFWMTNSFFVNQITNSINQNKMFKFTLMANFLSLGGLPPFLGFLPKWLTIWSLILNQMYTLTFFLIVLTLIMLFIYIRLIFSSLLISSAENKIFKIKFNNFYLILLNFLTLSSLILCTYLFNFL